MNEGTGRNLIKLATYLFAASPLKTGMQTVQDTRGAILVLKVVTVTSGSITDLNIYIPDNPAKQEAPVAAEEFKVYGFAALGINAPGVYPFVICADGIADITATGKKLGPWPPHFDVELLLANPSSIKFELDVLWLV